MDEQNSPGFPLCLCSHHGPPPQSKGPMGPQKSSCPTAFCYRWVPEGVSDWLEVTQQVQGSTGARGWPSCSWAHPETSHSICRPKRQVTLARRDKSFLYWPSCCWVRCNLPRDALRVASWAVNSETIPPEAWAPFCHLPSPGENSGSARERMSGPCVEVAQMLPHLGWGDGKKAECRDTGLLAGRAREGLCRPWVAWEEGDPGGEPGRG